MSTTRGPAAPASGSEYPTFEELAADPEIAALLEFEPAPRKNKRQDGWTPALQKRFIAYLAFTGSPNKAAEAVGKNRHGVEKVYKAEGAEEFRASWDGAVELFADRDADRILIENAPMAGIRPPFVDGRRKRGGSGQPGPLPGHPSTGSGQVWNEFGEWEEEDSYWQRAEEAKDSVSNKLLRIRRLYLQEIADEPIKRAAFEVLTDLPIDWERARRLEPQADEPWRNPNLMRDPDILLTAENGWLGGEFVHGPDKRAEVRELFNRYRDEQRGGDE